MAIKKDLQKIFSLESLTVKLMTGIEPVTPSLPRKCSTSEPHQPVLNGSVKIRKLLPDPLNGIVHTLAAFMKFLCYSVITLSL